MRSNREFALFVNYAYRSCNEVLTCLELARFLRLCLPNGKITNLEEEGIELSRMLYAFCKKLGRPT